MLRIKDFAKLYRHVLCRVKPVNSRGLSACGPDPRPAQDPLRRKDREACPPPPPPPPPPPKDDSLLWGAIAAAVVTAAFVVAAKQNPELRDWVTIYAPWLDDVIAVAFQENVSYGRFLADAVDGSRRLFLDYLEETKRGPPKECSLEEPPHGNVKVVEPIRQTIMPCEENADEEDKVVCEVTPPPLVTLDIGEMERCLKELGESMLINYLTARDVCRLYNKTVEDALNNYTQSKMDALQTAEEERRRLVKESLCNASEAKCKLDQLAKYLGCGVVSCKEDIDALHAMVKNMRSNIERVRIKYQWEEDKSVVLDDAWKMVKETVEKFMLENEALIPGLKYDNPKSKITGDPDLLLYHTSRYVQKLTAELDEAAEAMTERVNLAVDALPYCPKRCDHIMAATAKKQAQLGPYYNKLLEAQKAENDENLRKCLERQECQFVMKLEKRIEDKQKSLERQLAEMVAQRVAKERQQMKLDFTSLNDKLRIVEAKLNARLKAENESRRSQELWSAGVGLLSATKKGTPRICVKKELKAVEKAAGDNDPLVMAVLGGIPQSVREHGLVPASVLKKRYDNMEKVALKVAMVEQEGGPLPIYAISWIQSLFLFMKMRSIPLEEMGQKPTDPVSEDLDTFDLLQRARHYMDRDELASAMRFVAALRGASRGAAHAWLEDARAHLAARQAADALLAHAHSLGVNYI